jgi:hypothetical protein
MRRTINIGGKDIDMVANGLTPVIYKRIFRRDFLAETQKEDLDLTIFQELGFVMAMQSEKPMKELMEGLTIENYYEWLEGFGAMDIISKVNEIFAVYQAQNRPTSIPKKKRD